MYRWDECSIRSPLLADESECETQTSIKIPNAALICAHVMTTAMPVVTARLQVLEEKNLDRPGLTVMASVGGPSWVYLSILQSAGFGDPGPLSQVQIIGSSSARGSVFIFHHARWLLPLGVIRWACWKSLDVPSE